MAASCASSSASLAAAVSGPRLATERRSSYNLLPSRRFSIPSLSINSVSKHLPSDLKEKWDALEDKSIVLLYGGGAIVGIWLSSAVVGAIDSLPLFPKIMELVGLGYTGWFIYRYLIFKSSRKELATDIEEFRKKIMGNE